MLSKILEIQNHEIKVRQRSSKNSPKTPFPKGKRENSLTKKLREKSLSALNEMLAKQKQETQMGAAGPFPKISPLQASLESKASLKIDPSIQITQLYHKMVETLIHIDRKGIQETTLFLDGNAFSHSLFQGARITITEYSTAPKIFNIEFSADPKALSLFEAHAAELVNALQNGHFGFGVNRIDAYLLTENEKHALPPVERDLEKEEEKNR